MSVLHARPATGRGDTARRGEAPAVKSLLASLRSHDAYTYRHSLRTVRLSLLIGRACGVETPGRLRVLCLGAVVHDVGKIFIPGEVLHKPEALSAAEWGAVKRHPLDGARMMLGVASPEGVRRVVAEHHERWDGRGYPAGLRGEGIDFNARVVAVADAFDAMTSERPYRPAASYEAAAAELERCAGTQFDPEVVLAFLRAPRARLDRIIGHGARA
ncbi:MAG TPA: HD domain-containing phosphohydrolase [Pyrinomonadaceae bacterium]|jgi:HD-GYP domain-containing protein (c-di-GMP phosphodiesterase class II)